MSRMQMQTFVRVRPPKKTETNVLVCEPKIGSRIATPQIPEGVSFPGVLGPASTQRDCFVTCGAPMLDAALEGRNALLFAYGQTGSGKTFSMLGADGGSNPLLLDGLVPQMCTEILRRFSQMEKEKGLKCSLVASFIEVSNERIRDLLATGKDQGVLKVQADGASMAKGRAPVDAVTQVVRTAPELLSLVEKAVERRDRGQTEHNEHSSRSHAMLTLTLERRTAKTMTTSGIFLLDLAGSETFKESQPHQQINVGLLALGRVLRALAAGSSHVPYRDSVLTRLLQGLMGGNSTAQMTMLACVNPGQKESGETTNVIEYARSATSITTRGVDEDQGLGDAAAAALDTRSDPMHGDKLDLDENLMRHTETVDTKTCGQLYVRCVGNPADPLILYFHGLDEGRTSFEFNDLVVSLQQLMVARAAERAEEEAEKAAEAEKAEGEAAAPADSPAASPAEPPVEAPAGSAAEPSAPSATAAPEPDAPTGPAAEQRERVASDASEGGAASGEASPASPTGKRPTGTKKGGKKKGGAAEGSPEAARRAESGGSGTPTSKGRRGSTLKDGAAKEAPAAAASVVEPAPEELGVPDMDTTEGDDRFIKLRSEVSVALLDEMRELQQVPHTLTPPPHTIRPPPPPPPPPPVTPPSGVPVRARSRKRVQALKRVSSERRASNASSG